MGKSIYTLEFEIHSKEIPGVMLGSKPALHPVSVSRVLKINDEIIFQKEETFESYCKEKSFMSDFISSITPTVIEELKKGNYPKVIPEI